MLSAPDFEKKQIVFAMVSRGEKLSFKNDNLIITDDVGKIRYQSTCYRLFALIVVGHASITSGLLQRADKFGFSIVLTSHSLKPYAYFNAKAEGNVVLRRKQYQYNSLDLAQSIVANKIDVQLTALKKIREKDFELKAAITSLQEYKNRLPDESLTLKELLGIEGIASRVYFKQLFSGCRWKGRKPRVKHDTTNALLDIGYTLLFNVLETLLNLYGFDTYQGIYHQEFYQRKSLVCDLVEPFRPIVDYKVRKAHQLKQIREEDFHVANNQYKLFGNSAKPYVSFLLQAILEHKSEYFDYVQSYYRAFMRDKPSKEFPVFAGI